MTAREPVEIFISYKKDGDRKGDRQGRVFVEELAAATDVEATRIGAVINLWYDKELRVGTEWSAGIQGAMDQAEVFVLVYSPGFFDKGGYIAEHEMPSVIRHLKAERKARNAGTIIPVVRAGVELPSGIPEEFAELRKLQAAYEGRPVGLLEPDSKGEALREVAQSIVSAATAVYSRRQSTSLRAVVETLEADLVAVNTELARDPQTSPEDQLKAPLKAFLEEAGSVLGKSSIAVFTEHRSVEGDDVQGVRLDLSVKFESGELIGHVELKAPSKSANPARPTGWSSHDRKQWKKLQDHPNLLYSNGQEWSLWRNSVNGPVGHVLLQPDGTGRIPDGQLRDLAVMLGDFLTWKTIVPSTPRALARRLAPLAGLLRDAVIDHVSATTDGSGPESKSGLAAMYSTWKNDLMPGATVKEFSDSFAQTFTYALLLARIESGKSEAFSTERVSGILDASGHKLLGSVLQLMNQRANREPVEAPLGLLEATIGAVDPAKLTAKSDPWLYFYEDFLAEYDHKMRRDAGVYYTPIEVVRAQTRLVDDVLKSRFGLRRGLGDGQVQILDPALGTGTYLLSVAERVLATSPAPADDARSLAKRLNGFELLVGPYAVAHLRLTQMLEKAGAEMGADGVNVFLTNSLTDPGDVSDAGQQMSIWEVLQNVTEDNRRAGVIKNDRTNIRVILGNPPYDRGSRAKALGAGSQKHHNVVLEGRDGNLPLLEDFLGPLRAAGQGGHAKNLYNSYVYFWRWAMWKAGEQNPASPGIVSFITSSSYLRGPGFAGMREYMQQLFDEIWIIDLGGEGRGAVTEENVFNIQTPVCIAVCVQRATNRNGSTIKPSDRKRSKAGIWYQKLTGKRDDKLASLAFVEDPYAISDDWTKVLPTHWGQKFVGGTEGRFSEWPLVSDVFPWSHSGVQFKRKWPIATSKKALERRWQALFATNGADPALFKESTDRVISEVYSEVTTGQPLVPLSKPQARDSMLEPTQYGYRSFDRQWALPDNRLASRIRPQLWNTWSGKQLYFASLTSTPLGAGPALTVTSFVPDLHFFRGSFGAKNAMPLYRDRTTQSPNVACGLLASLTKAYSRPVSAEDLACYTFGLLGTGAYTARFAAELLESAARVPLTMDPKLFAQVAEFGRDLIWHETYGERFGSLNQFGQAEPLQLNGTAKLQEATPADADRYPEKFVYLESAQELHVGDGVFTKVSSEVMRFSVSGMSVVRSWLGYRMKEPAGKSSSMLDRVQALNWEFDSELLELLWLVEYMVAAESTGADLLELVVEGQLYAVQESDRPTNAERRVPSAAELLQTGELLDLG